MQKTVTQLFSEVRSLLSTEMEPWGRMVESSRSGGSTSGSRKAPQSSNKEVTVKDLKNYIDVLSEAVAKLGYVSSTTNDAGLRLILEGIEHELLQVHHFLDYHTDEGFLQFRPGDTP